MMLFLNKYSLDSTTDKFITYGDLDSKLYSFWEKIIFTKIKKLQVILDLKVHGF